MNIVVAKNLKRKFANVFLMLLTIGFTFGCCASNKDLDKNYQSYFDNVSNVEHLQKSTVMIFHETNTGKIICSGFFISPRLLVTARHCFVEDHILIESANDQGKETSIKIPIDHMMARANFHDNHKAINVHFAVSEQYFANSEDIVSKDFIRGKIVWSPVIDLSSKNETHDFVIIELNNGQPSSKHWLEIQEKKPNVGSQVFAISHPLGNPWVASFGRIAKFYYDFMFYPKFNLIEIQMPVDSGSSGSAAVDNDGKVIGIVHTVNKHRNLSSLIPSYVLIEELKKLKSSGPN